MKLISWNVAGYRACLKKGFVDFFEEEQADIFCLQEVKATKEQIEYIPKDYFSYLNVAEKKGYSGTMIYTKKEPLQVSYGMGIEEHDHEGRIITLEYPTFFLVNVYVPNAKQELERLPYRMEWEDAFKEYVGKLKEKKMVIICGDLNVAHEEIDIKNARANVGHAGFTNEEREKFSKLLESGFIDTYRHFYPNRVQYSWWSYLFHARENNAGWRIDYFLVDKDHINQIKDSIIYDNILGSDHCPIGIELKEEL
ncbi:MAG: exodeoxyribonuclease III [Bacilli bacterium]|nr:exodeoxyribonuclease III [Bacilli bacterium]